MNRLTLNRLPLLFALLAGLLVTACNSSKKFQASFTEDKPLFAAINELNKHPNNTKAQNDLRVLYQQAVERHEQTIAAYTNSRDEQKWDKMLSALNALQHMYTSLQATPASFNIVQPENYTAQLQALREDAADYFYQAGMDAMKANARQDQLEAYTLFQKANSYVTGYRDVNRLMKQSYENSVVNVVINPIEEDNFFYNSWNNTGFRYRPEDYQQSLVRELGGRNANRVPARFYTDQDARRENINPDWIVDVRWRNVDANTSMPSRFTREVSRSVKVGTDSTGKPIYEKVYATLSVSERTITVRGDLDYRVNDVVSNANIDQGLLTDQVSWTESYATYRGDSRALDAADWALINNRNFNRGISKADVMNSLMRRLYPDLRRRLEQAMA